MERYLAKGMLLLSPAQNNSSMKPLNFDIFTDYDAYASSVGEDINKEAGVLQEDGENPGIDDYLVPIIPTGNQ